MEFHRRHALFRIRKSAWFAVALLVLFFIHNAFLTQVAEPVTSPEPSADSLGTDSLSLLFCRGIVDSVPFGIDSEFYERRDRVYAVVQGDSLPDLELVWYSGGNEKARFPCVKDLPCLSSLGPDSLAVGEWSVDVILGRRLLASRQFRIFPM